MAPNFFTKFRFPQPLPRRAGCCWAGLLLMGLIDGLAKGLDFARVDDEDSRTKKNETEQQQLPRTTDARLKAVRRRHTVVPGEPVVGLVLLSSPR